MTAKHSKTDRGFELVEWSDFSEATESVAFRDVTAAALSEFEEWLREEV